MKGAKKKILPYIPTIILSPLYFVSIAYFITLVYKLKPSIIPQKISKFLR